MLKETVFKIETIRKEALKKSDYVDSQTELRERLMKRLEPLLIWCSLNDKDVTLSPMRLSCEQIVEGESFYKVTLSMKFTVDVAEVKK